MSEILVPSKKSNTAAELFSFASGNAASDALPAIVIIEEKGFSSRKVAEIAFGLFIAFLLWQLDNELVSKFFDKFFVPTIGLIVIASFAIQGYRFKPGCVLVKDGSLAFLQVLRHDGDGGDWGVERILRVSLDEIRSVDYANWHIKETCMIETDQHKITVQRNPIQNKIGFYDLPGVSVQLTIKRLHEFLTLHSRGTGR